MGTVVGVGYSIHRNPAEAGKEAALKALGQVGNAKPDFVLVFATVGYDQQLLIRSIRESTSEAPLSGCSCEGIITQEAIYETNFGVAIMVINSDELRFNHACVKGIGQQADIAGERLAEQINSFLTVDTMACFLMPDGLVFNYDPFRKSFEAALKRDSPLPVFGGLASDNWVSKKTYQYHDGEVFSEGIACVVLSGNGDIAWGVSHGCVPLGTKRIITRGGSALGCRSARASWRPTEDRSRFRANRARGQPLPLFCRYRFAMDTPFESVEKRPWQ